MLASLLGVCFLVGCLFPCRVFVSLFGACFLVGCLLPCRVEVRRARTPPAASRPGRATATRFSSQPLGPCPIAPRDEITPCGEPLTLTLSMLTLLTHALLALTFLKLTLLLDISLTLTSLRLTVLKRRAHLWAPLGLRAVYCAVNRESPPLGPFGPSRP